MKADNSTVAGIIAEAEDAGLIVKGTVIEHHRMDVMVLEIEEAYGDAGANALCDALEAAGYTHTW